MKHLLLPLLLMCPLALSAQPGRRENNLVQLRKDFVNPPLSSKSRPLWFWNKPLSHDQTRKVMIASKEAGYYGLGILPSYGMTPDFMTPEFLEQYKYAVETADSLGMKLYLYDEYYFPSGMAGGQLVKQYPEAVSKRLDMHVTEFRVGPTVSGAIRYLPQGTILGAVAMETQSLRRIDLTSDNLNWARQNKLPMSFNLPPGHWKVMIFTLNPDSSSERNHVDYLSPEAVDRFIELTYEKYYKAFPDHFGTTIDYAFYDEPCLRWVQGGRTWTGDFNTKFEKRYGFSPILLYPALWFDIGPETQAARNYLLGFRAELFAAGFPKTINDWCRIHGIQLTGHVDQEEILNPVATCGDLMKAFKYQDIPAVDQIFYYGRSSFIYKVISSAANNYDRPIVATECFGAISRMPVKNLYKEAMDQFAKGINLMEPHAVWYTDAVDIQPDLSPTSAKFGEALPAFNEYIGRLQGLLQGGRHIADIAILYPIASLQGRYHFGDGDPGMGGVIPAEADYLDIGEMLSLDIRRDFTFIHPEILDEKCRVRKDKMQLQNSVNQEEFNVFILPGSQTISLSNLEKIKKFYEQGGTVIATSQLPSHADEFGKDEAVREIIASIFGEGADDTPGLIRVTASSTWNTGGFIPSYAVDSRPGTGWKPAQATLKGEWLEIGFGGERNVSGIRITGPDERPCSFRVQYLRGSELADAGRWEGAGQIKEVTFPPVAASSIRILLESGETDKVILYEIEILDGQNRNILAELKSSIQNTSDKDGNAYFLPAPTPALLKSILEASGTTRDIYFEKEYPVSGGNLTYIHKKLNGRDTWFFANSSDTPVDVPVLLKGKFTLQAWNPHTGQLASCPTTPVTRNRAEYTRAQLLLNPVESVCWIAE